MPKNVYLQLQDGLRDRLFDAKHERSRQLRRDVSQHEIAKGATKRLGEGDQPSQATSSRWFKGELRDVLMLSAVADECGVRRAWLLLGDGPMVDAPAADAPPDEGREELVPRLTPRSVPTVPTTRAGGVRRGR